jgi:hypothetical protein
MGHSKQVNVTASSSRICFGRGLSAGFDFRFESIVQTDHNLMD